MTEDRSEIDHYQNDGEEDGEWGDPIKPSSRRRLDAVVSVRFDPNELELIRKVAPDGNVSHFIRNAALEATSRKEGWTVKFASNGSNPRTIGCTSFADFPSLSDSSMVLANWKQPTVKLAQAS